MGVKANTKIEASMSAGAAVATVGVFAAGAAGDGDGFGVSAIAGGLGFAGGGGGSGERPWVVKIGGRLCDDPEIRARFAAACADFAGPLVVVHGGGAAVSALQEQLGFAPTFHEGRRVTQPEAMPVVEMVLSGRVNKDLVRALESAGRRATGLSGCDDKLIRARHVPELGAVGEPQTVHPNVLHRLLAAGITPVVSPVSLAAENGEQALNVNADEAACAIAKALGAQRLLLISDVAAVRIDDENQASMAISAIEGHIASGAVHGGMVPKLRSAADAISEGVGDVQIAGFDPGATNLCDLGGTRIHRGKGRPGPQLRTLQGSGGEGKATTNTDASLNNANDSGNGNGNGKNKAALRLVEEVMS